MLTFKSCTNLMGKRDTNARTIATQFPEHGCMSYLKTERSFESQGMWVIDVLGLLFVTCYPLVFVKRGGLP